MRFVCGIRQRRTRYTTVNTAQELSLIHISVAGDTLGGDMARGVGRGVYDLGTGVQVLPGTRKGDAGKLHAGCLLYTSRCV